MRIWPFLATTVASILALALVLLKLPTNDYLKYQQFDKGQSWRVRWVYERIRFDPRAIDIAIIGPSQSLYGANAPLLETRLAQAGFPGVHVANLSLIQPGEDLHELILRDLLTYKKPRIVLLGVAEQMSQSSHPAFAALATPKQVLHQTFGGNRAYLSNLLLSIYTQLQFCGIALNPHFFGYDERFRADRYGRVSPDTTRDETLPDGHVINHSKPSDRAVIENQLPAAVSHMHGRVYGDPLRAVQFGVPLRAYREMAAMIGESGARLLFLYEPLYKGQTRPNEFAYLSGMAPVIAGTRGKDDYRLFSDTDHHDRAGAAVVTTDLANWLVAHDRELLNSAATTPAGGTGTAIPSRYHQ